jgi:adenosyl cobinamide kinase/adenosyl cobinamide phosphate guanylyltransferase
MRRLTLILGGARSGKSARAERLALERAGERVWFVATAEPLDAEMRERIAAHRASRPAAWRTLEAPHDLAATLRSEQAQAGRAPSLVLLDCWTLLVSNHLLAAEAAGEPPRSAGRKLDEEIDGLMAWRRESDAALIVVSNEVGSGLVPMEPLGRAFRDLLGGSNARLASMADEVLLMVAGLVVPLRGEAEA